MEFTGIHRVISRKAVKNGKSEKAAKRLIHSGTFRRIVH
jgi:hypothetical protein